MSPGLYFIYFFLLQRRQPGSTLFPYTTLFRSGRRRQIELEHDRTVRLLGQVLRRAVELRAHVVERDVEIRAPRELQDRKSTRLNSSHSQISYAVFCLKKKNETLIPR